jgi:hypothetical protein
MCDSWNSRLLTSIPMHAGSKWPISCSKRTSVCRKSIASASCIHLYEADFNLLMGIYFAQTLVRHIENHRGFNIGCYGNRPGLSAHEPVLVEELQNSIGYLSRTNQVVTNNDAQACYDRIPPNLANLTSRLNVMDDAPCIVHGSTLDHMSYSLMTALGLSVKTYSNTDESKVYGTGQGSTYSPPAWVQIVSKLFDTHGKRAHGATYQSPDGHHKLFLHMLGFLDDTKNHVNDMMCSHPLSVDALVTLMAEGSQLWSDLHWNSTNCIFMLATGIRTQRLAVSGRHSQDYDPRQLSRLLHYRPLSQQVCRNRPSYSWPDKKSRSQPVVPV